MFGFILFVVVLAFVGRLFSRPFFGYRRPWNYYYPFGGFSPWGMGMGRYHRHHHGPMCHGPHHHHHMGRGRMW